MSVWDLDDFTLERIIGAGGIAEIWLATHPLLEGPVALKIARPALGQNPHVHAQFRREQRAAGVLDHRGLIPHMGSGMSEDGRPFLVMKLIRGRALSHFVRRPVSWPFLRAALIQLCEVLHYIHSQGVLHQDLKPANIMVDLEKRQIRVTDFGLARFEQADLGATTRHVLGTPAYMAPEQARGLIGKLGPHTDLYTVGILTYELLSGHKPFIDDTDQKIMLKHCSQRPPELVIRPGIKAPDTIHRVVRRLLAKNPEQRYSSALSLRAVLSAQR